ncbi:MAG: InlB B-repeat-containing protein, partial [Anaeroplasmataceae bacterium]|nr:InlB B-repeat-containing protein [Anaeroplasmataceae bacterium]
SMDTAITADITIVAQWKANEAPVAKFTVSFDSKGGSDVAALTDLADGSKITPPADPTKEGYRFAGWYTDEECKDAWDFDADTVTSSMTLYAKWNSLVKISQAAVESLQTAICIDGSYVYTSQNFGVEEAGITTIFEPTSVKVLEYDLESKAELYLMEIVEKNGNCAYVQHSIQNGVTFKDLTVPFDDFDNPFKDLTIDNFAHVSDNVFQVIDDGAGNLKAIASCITGWNENIKSILVTVEDDKIVSVVIETNVMTKTATIDGEEVTDSYSVVYTFDIKDHGTAKTGILVDPYERVPEHDLLEAALNNMNHNHTIHCLDVALGYEDITYDILVNENVIWDTYDNDGTTYGYAEVDGNVYEFKYTDGVVTVGDPLNVSSLSIISSYFTAFAPEVMKYVGNNTFRSYTTELAQEIISYIGPDYDRQRLGEYASYVEIEIKDGYVYRVTFDYSVYGLESTLTMIYDAFDETTIDIDFSDIEHTSVLDPYMGTWTTSEAGGHTIVVNDSGIFVDDAEYVITDYDAEYGFTGTVDGATYYLTLWTEREIVFYNETETVFWFFQKEGATEELVTIPDELKGVWVSTDETMTVTIQTHAVFVNGMPIDLVYYSASDEMLTVSYNGGSYYLFTSVDEKTGDIYLFFARNDLSERYQLYLTTQSIGFEISTSYVGIWENEDDDIRIVIRYSGITINGETYVITSYDQNDGFVGTLGNVTGYMIAPYFTTTDKLQVGTMSNNSVVTKISDNPKDEDTKIYEVHYGYYEGTAEDDTKYT